MSKACLWLWRCAIRCAARRRFIVQEPAGTAARGNSERRSRVRARAGEVSSPRLGVGVGVILREGGFALDDGHAGPIPWRLATHPRLGVKPDRIHSKPAGRERRAMTRGDNRPVDRAAPVRSGARANPLARMLGLCCTNHAISPPRLALLSLSQQTHFCLGKATSTCGPWVVRATFILPSGGTRRRYRLPARVPSTESTSCLQTHVVRRPGRLFARVCAMRRAR